MPGVKSRGTGTEACPVTNCPFVGPSRAMTVHWRSFHEESILLYLCPLPGCSWQTPKPQGLRQHWENRHQASRQQSGELRTLPLLANFMKNQHRRDPGNCWPPVPPLQKPIGCLPHGSKGTILVQVQRILSTMRMPTPGQLSLVAPPSLPPRFTASHTSSTARRGPEGGGKEHPTTGGRRPGDGSRDGSFACSDSGDPWQETADMFGLSNRYRQLASLYASGSC